MNVRSLDELELGRRVAVHLIIENALPPLARLTAIVCRGDEATHGLCRR